MESRQEPIKRTSLNTRIPIVVFNEILIPQDSLTETNVTRKRSVVGSSYLYSKIILKFQLFVFFFIYIFHALENMENNNTSHGMPK